MDLAPGTILDNKYTICKTLGRGAMGVVYLAVDIGNSARQYAVKELILHDDPREREIARELFHKEAKILGELSNPRLPRIYGTFIRNGKNYLVMDFIPGENLEEILRKPPGKLPEDEAINIIIQLAEVLDYLHNNYSGPIVYRDLKPANIIITETGTVKLIDFGIARRYNPSKHTDTFRFGTPGYAAPEQFRGRGQSTPLSDMYGLGVILFQLLTGYDPTVTPFKFPPMRDLNPDISNELERIVLRAIQLRYQERYVNMRVFIDTLAIYIKEKEKTKTSANIVRNKVQKSSPPVPYQSKGKSPAGISSSPPVKALTDFLSFGTFKNLPKKFIFASGISLLSFGIVSGSIALSILGNFGSFLPEDFNCIFPAGLVTGIIVFFSILGGDIKLN